VFGLLERPEDGLSFFDAGLFGSVGKKRPWTLPNSLSEWTGGSAISDEESCSSSSDAQGFPIASSR